MSRKNGKKGFLKLSNENMAMMDREESGSEIELLDLTQLDHSQLPEHINERYLIPHRTHTHSLSLYNNVTHCDIIQGFIEELSFL